MKNLHSRLEELAKISSVLEPTKTERKDQQGQVMAFANEFLNGMTSLPGYAKAELTQDFSISGNPRPLNELIGIYKNEVAHKGIYACSGAHFGYIPGGGLPISGLADYMVAITNEYAGVHFASPGAVAIENAVLDWLKDIFGFPKSAVGNLASGGSIANLIALTAARDKFGVKNERIKKSVIYLSSHVHHCIKKALRIIGLEDVVVREMELDEEFRLQPDLIHQQIREDKANGLSPFLVIASAGTTDTGVVDPLKAIGELAQEEGLWYHIDAAYGGFFILVDQTKPLFEGIDLADSLVIDPHKGLFLPYGVGAVLVKDKEAVMYSHHYFANYMQDILGENLPVNPADVSPELTKHFRGLRAWLPLQHYGVEPFKACLEEKLLLTHYFREQLVELGFEVGPEPDLSVSYFWYPYQNGDVNAYNKRLLDLLHEDGDVFLSSTQLNGQFVIRMALLVFRTKKEMIDRAVTMIKKAMVKMNAS